MTPSSMDELTQLKTARDAAIRAAQTAVYNTTRLTRLLTILNEPGPRDALLDRVLSTLSELFSADIVVLVDPVGTGSLVPLAATGLSEDLACEKLSDAGDSYTLAAIQGQVPVLRANVQADPNADFQLRELGAETAVWLPVVGSQAARGVLILARCRPEPFVQSDVSLLSAMAYRVGLMLEQAQHGVQMEQIVRTGREIGRSLDIPSLSEEIVARFPSIVGGDASVLVLIDSAGRMSCAAQVGLDPSLNSSWCCFTEGFMKDTNIIEIPYSVTDLRALLNDPHNCKPMPIGPVRALLAVPIRRERSLVGLLMAMRFSMLPFNPDTLQIAMLYAAQASAALENARLYQVVRDELGERERAERALRSSDERFRSMIRSVSDVIMILSEDGTIQYASPAVETLWGSKVESLLGQPILSRIHSDDSDEMDNLIKKLLKQPQETLTGVVRLHHSQGHWRYFEVILTNQLNDPAVGGIVSTYHDITERKMYEQELTNLAYRDSLTGLANRAFFGERLKQALSRADMYRRSVAVIFFDLDNFKIINDSLGHDWGDKVLREVAVRVHSLLRQDDLAARFGGDEFTILLEDVRGVEDVIALVNRLMDVVREPIPLKGHEVYIGCSMGIAISTPNEDSTEDLLRRADLAMYAAKGNGKGSYAVFDAQMNITAMQRLELEADLRQALKRKELRIYYQPIVSLENGRIVEVEALLHWDHPRIGLIAPSEMIPLAKETGLIVDLGQWVLKEACCQVRAWQEKFAGSPSFGLDINLSSRQIRHSALIDEIQMALQESHLPPSSLMLECSEASLVNDPTMSIARMKKIKDFGSRTALDNIGQDYASLKLLTQFTVDTIKIGPAIVQRMMQDERDRVIVRSLIEAAGAFGINVIGVGIETEDQARALRAMGCRIGQGALFAVPLPADQMEAYLAKQ